MNTLELRRLTRLALALLVCAAMAACSDDDDGAADAGPPDAGPICGNGILEAGEECDDGNTDNRDGCCNTCLLCPICDVEPFATCDASTVCCVDSQDLPTECAAPASGTGASRCLRACAAGNDCDWSNDCNARFPGHCFPAYCGPEENGLPVNGPCQVNGKPGFCYPQSTAEADWGLCVEPGTLPAGAACERGWSLDEYPRDVETCADGICTTWVGGQVPRCVAFCDPVTAFDASGIGADGCPAGTNCLDFAALSGTTGQRLADKGLCVPTPGSDPEGLQACDAITGELVPTRALRCEDVAPDTRCAPYRNGSLYGTCQPAEPAPLALGAPCDPAAELLPCGAGATCGLADPFGTGDATDTACLELCDGAVAGWACATAGFACTSLSNGVEDGSPTRFGLCAPPPSP